MHMSLCYHQPHANLQSFEELSFMKSLIHRYCMLSFLLLPPIVSTVTYIEVWASGWNNRAQREAGHLTLPEVLDVDNALANLKRNFSPRNVGPALPYWRSLV